MTKVEKIRLLAIEICKRRGLEPNKLVCKHMPELITSPYMAGFFIPDLQFQMPAWKLFIYDAEVALEALEAFRHA